MINKTVEPIIVKIDKIAPDGKIGSLTATLANMTNGVKVGISDVQNAIGVSGFLATENMVKNPINTRKIIGNWICCPSSSVLTIAPMAAYKLA